MDTDFCFDLYNFLLAMHKEGWSSKALKYFLAGKKESPGLKFLITYFC